VAQFWVNGSSNPASGVSHTFLDGATGCAHNGPRASEFQTKRGRLLR
jgi:hypothetical protein